MKNKLVFYLIILVIFVFMYIVTFKYKSDYRKNYKNNKLFFMSGISMYVVDKFLKKVVLKGRAGQRENLKKLKVKDITYDDEYQYLVGKVSKCILIFTVVISVGVLYSFTQNLKDVQYETILMRPDDGSASKIYKLNVGKYKNASESESINIEVEKRQYSDKDVYEMFDKNYECVIEKMLGDNSDTDNIKYNLSFDSEYSEMGIGLSWGCKDREVIGYSGEIVSDSETDTIIYLTMSYEGRSRNYEIEVHVIPTKNNTLEQKIQNIVNDSDSYKSEVVLPKKVEGEKVFFTRPNDNTDIPFFILGIVVAAFICIGGDSDMKKEVKQRNLEMERDYPDIVSKLMLLTAAGLSVRMSWKRIVSDYENHTKLNGKRYAYEEMKLTENKMDSGISEPDAYAEFGKRCGLRNYVKLSSILEQNIKKGNKGIKETLEYEVREAFEIRKSAAKKRGEEAGTKMLFPMLVMLIVSILIIIIPSFMTM